MSADTNLRLLRAWQPEFSTAWSHDGGAFPDAYPRWSSNYFGRGNTTVDQIRSDSEARLFHVEEAAKVLAIGRTKAYELIAAGQLHAIHLGRLTRVSSREVDRFVRSIDRQPRAVPQDSGVRET